MYFTFNNNKVPVLPTDIVPIPFGGDGVRTVAQDLGMSAEDISKAEQEFQMNVAIAHRVSNYPKIETQLDMLYHDIKNGTLESGAWIQAIEQVKTTFPKE